MASVASCFMLFSDSTMTEVLEQPERKRQVQNNRNMNPEEDDFESCYLVEKPPKLRKSDLERTIEAMEGSVESSLSSDGICAHPQHLHSFQQINFLLSWKTCAGCQSRIQTVVFGAGNDSAKQVVRCLACGVYAHRRCAMNPPLAKSLWKESCSVNQQALENIKEGQKVDSLDFSFVRDTDDDEKDAADMVESSTHSQTLEWTTDGPPEHWAAVAKPQVEHFSAENTVEGDEPNSDPDAPLHYASHPFASVSRALQENILAHFRNRRNEEGITTTQQANGNEAMKESLLDKAMSAENSESKPSENHPVVHFVNGTVNAVRTTAAIPGRIGAATLAGGIAGGVAGLALAGPAGAMAGVQFGKTAGALGILLEGSVSVGVFVASVATAGFTAKHIQEHMEERRILEMGEHGATRKVLLVRPNIKIDENWEKICAEAVASAPTTKVGLFQGPDASRDRYRRDLDIIQPTEEEIPTNDKVFLLVSRILNDKGSLPGHVYRSLTDKFFERVQNRTELQEEGYTDSEASGRSRRDDTHAIIKYVTATLMEVRSGFDASPSITELTATAVESLVFGKVYDSVLEEIFEEASEKDTSLMQKIETCENDPNIHKIVAGNISDSAVRSLQRLPTAHSAVNKLEDCVVFLESISEHFAATGGTHESLCADSLLKMVCQHILMAKVDHLNAEITFLEEFARDEQLLRGREGYSLVTLQAALHFLNMCTDVENDIFGQDDEEENLPLTRSSDLDESVEII